MKFREILYLLGAKPALRHYPHRVDRFELAPGDSVEFANWLHPSARAKSIDPAAVAALSEFLKPGDTAIDVGAHIGDTSVPMALAVGEQGCVFAFEPNPRAFAVLEVNASLNRGRTRIVPLPYAASDAPGKLTFRYSDPGLCNGGELRGVSRWRHAHAFEIEVEAVAAESWLRERYPDELSRLKYIKVDSEGADPAIIRVMEGLLQDYRPYLRCEIYRHLPGAERKEFFRYLLDRDYVIHRYLGPVEYRGPVLGPDDACQQDHYDIFAVPAELA